MAQRRSKQRELTLEVLHDSSDHPTADAVFARVRQGLPKVSLGTIYRNLDQLCREGRALKLNTGGAEKRYDGNTRPHDHVRCTDCELIVDLERVRAPGLMEEAELQSGFAIKDFSIEFQGICEACAKGRAEPIHTHANA
ncbi:MAG: transcriptional repressor [Candidatus Methylomirabilia bacterium]